MSEAEGSNKDFEVKLAWSAVILTWRGAWPWGPRMAEGMLLGHRRAETHGVRAGGGKSLLCS